MFSGSRSHDFSCKYENYDLLTLEYNYLKIRKYSEYNKKVNKVIDKIKLMVYSRDIKKKRTLTKTKEVYSRSYDKKIRRNVRMIRFQNVEDGPMA